MAIFNTRRASLVSFGDLLTRLLRGLSIGRARLIVEQIRRLVDAGQLDRLVILTLSAAGDEDRPLAAVVAVLQQGLEGEQIGDVATVVHAGGLVDFEDTLESDVAANLAVALNRELCKQGVRFAQWATDQDDTQGRPTPESLKWCAALGFQPIGNLEYLCGSVSNDASEPFGSPFSSAVENQSLCFEPLAWDDPAAFTRLIALVDRTYTDTLDCPDLAKFRSAKQVLNGYRMSDVFAPDLWFTVTDYDGQEAGCAIFANHPAARLAEPGNMAINSSSIEIVYMGLVPDSRGKGIGKQLVQKSFDIARQIGADQVLLAVDQINHPAKSIYQLAGLRPIFSETVWVKSIGPK